MATMSEAFDSERALRDAFPEYVQLDGEARAALEQLIQDGAIQLTQEPQRIDEARAAMHRLAERMESHRRNSATSVVTQPQFARALGDLCPLWPICA